MFPLILGALKNGRLGLELMVSMLSENPAKIFGLEGKGCLEEGADADLVMFQEGVTTKLTQDGVTCHSGWSPFVGREVGNILFPEDIFHHRGTAFIWDNL